MDEQALRGLIADVKHGKLSRRAFIFVGNGDSAGLHHPAYNFNDDAILYGTSYWIRLVETQLAA